ncbi:hypothetical protein XENOCAPTIV_021980 [Xenoophorus captivus]|uniref:Uncharacterized protein n=1 Tax=Xenoophorus captivus TaxID=1517983 RepID=A0ABV0S5P0_9TELE
MKGIGSDKETILDLITSWSNAQRQEVISAYKCSFGQDLYAAGEEKWGTDEATFIMILGNRSVTHLRMGFGFAECAMLCQTDRYSLAGEFFPEAAQIAYKMWELSAMTKVQVWIPSTL